MKTGTLFFRLLSISIISLWLSACKNAGTENTTSDQKGLKDYSPFPIGTALNYRPLCNDSIQKIVLANFNSLTASSDLKIYRIAAKPDTFNFTLGDSIVNFCQKHNIRMFGHNLVWHFGLPQWIRDSISDKGAPWLDKFLHHYITTVVAHYKGKIAAWDVINEGMETRGGEYRKSVFYNILGKEYIEKAFRYAHKADPEADLFYNDFNIERDTAKLNGVLKMIRELKEKNVPITGLGFQMHIRMDIPDSTIAYCLKKGAETGLKIHLSEVDIIFNKHDDTKGGGIQIVDSLTPQMLVKQAEKYKHLVEMYRTIVPKEQQFGVTFWGFNDRDTWIKGFFNLKDWPTLFDEKLQPKPAYYGFIEGLKEEI